MRMLPLMKGSSWSSWRKMTRPFESSIRRGCTGLKGWSEGIGIFFHGSALAEGVGAVWGLAGAVCWETAAKVERRIGNKAINGRLVEGVFPRFILHLRRSVRMGLRVLPG